MYVMYVCMYIYYLIICINIFHPNHINPSLITSCCVGCIGENNTLAFSMIYSTTEFLKFMSSISVLGFGPRNNVGPKTTERFLGVIKFSDPCSFTLFSIIIIIMMINNNDDNDNNNNIYIYILINNQRCRLLVNTKRC